MIKEKQILSISRGPQFKLKGVAYFAMFLVLLVLLTVASFMISEYAVAIVILIISIVLFSYILDIQGFEIDSKEMKIRTYKDFLWIRYGKWEDFNNYTIVCLTNENLHISTSEGVDHAYDTFHYYYVKLLDENHQKEIYLGEYTNYYEALKISKSISGSNGLVFKDLVRRRR